MAQAAIEGQEGQRIYLHRVVLRGRCQPLPIRTEAEAPNRSGVALQRETVFASSFSFKATSKIPASPILRQLQPMRRWAEREGLAQSHPLG